MTFGLQPGNEKQGGGFHSWPTKFTTRKKNPRWSTRGSWKFFGPPKLTTHPRSCSSSPEQVPYTVSTLSQPAPPPSPAHRRSAAPHFYTRSSICGFVTESSESKFLHSFAGRSDRSEGFPQPGSSEDGGGLSKGADGGWSYRACYAASKLVSLRLERSRFYHGVRIRGACAHKTDSAVAHQDGTRRIRQSPRRTQGINQLPEQRGRVFLARLLLGDAASLSATRSDGGCSGFYGPSTDTVLVACTALARRQSRRARAGMFTSGGA